MRAHKHPYAGQDFQKRNEDDLSQDRSRPGELIDSSKGAVHEIHLDMEGGFPAIRKETE